MRETLQGRTEDPYIVEMLRLEPLLRAYLHRFVPKPADLDDLLQETYARLLAVPPQRREAIKSMQAFGLTAARNIALDWARRRQIVPIDLLADLDALGVSDSGLEDMANVHQELSRLAEAVGGLPDRCAEVFTLRKVYGWSQQEIATRLGISVSTVEQHLVKAVRRCANFMVAADPQRVQRPFLRGRLKKWRQGEQG